jgi:hypothetical protein
VQGHDGVVVCWADENDIDHEGGCGTTAVGGADAGKSDPHSVLIDVDVHRLSSRRVANDEAVLLELIPAVTALPDGDEVTLAIDLNRCGAALLIILARRRLNV